MRHSASMSQSINNKKMGNLKQCLLHTYMALQMYARQMVVLTYANVCDRNDHISIPRRIREFEVGSRKI